MPGKMAASTEARFASWWWDSDQNKNVTAPFGLTRRIQYEYREQRQYSQNFLRVQTNIYFLNGLRHREFCEYGILKFKEFYRGFLKISL
jgi:hypothetical protein